LPLLEILCKNKYFLFKKINFNYIKHKKEIIDKLEKYLKNITYKILLKKTPSKKYKILKKNNHHL
jgi:hypothetical protein